MEDDEKAELVWRPENVAISNVQEGFNFIY